MVDMIEPITLINEDGTTVNPRRTVLARLMSVGHTEFYEAYGTELRPEVKFVLADAFDYEGEMLVQHSADLYRVIRTYMIGHGIELTVAKASAEERRLWLNEL